jgi:hypothetical protein
MNKSIRKFILRILILSLVLVPFVLLGSAQTDKVSLERTVIYNINPNDSANVTILYKFETISESDANLTIFMDNIYEISKDLDNIKIYSPNTPITYSEHKFSSIDEGLQRIELYEYSHFLKEKKGEDDWNHVFIIGFNLKLPPHKIILLSVSYSIEKIISQKFQGEPKTFRFLAPNSYQLDLKGNNNSKIDIIIKKIMLSLIYLRTVIIILN